MNAWCSSRASAPSGCRAEPLRHHVRQPLNSRVEQPPPTPPQPPAPKHSLMRNLGAFFGEIGKAVRADVTPRATVVPVQQHERSAPIDTPTGPGQARTHVREELEVTDGTLTARRVVTHEVTAPLPPPPAPPPPSQQERP
jgi:hypothetical protein